MKVPKHYVSKLALYGRSGKLLMRVITPYYGEWALAEGAADGSDDDKGDGDSDKGDVEPPDPAKELERLKAELAARDEKLKALAPRLEAIEKAEREREEAKRRKEEAEKLKRGEAEKLIEEKNKTLTDLEAKLKEYEARDKARAEELYAKLPEPAQQAIAPMKDTLPPAQWLTLVEKQAAFAQAVTAGADKDSGGEVFIPSSGGGGVTKGKNGTVTLSPKAQEILQQEGEGLDFIEGKLTVQRVRDGETGAVVSRFSRPVREYFRDMQRASLFRVSDIKEKR